MDNTINKEIFTFKDNVEDTRGKEAPKHVEYYNYDYKLKSDPKANIKLEKVICGEFTGEYILHLINVNNSQSFTVKSNELIKYLDVTHKGKTNFGNIISKNISDISQMLSESELNTVFHKNNDIQINHVSGPISTTQRGLNNEQLLGYNLPNKTQQNSEFKHRHTIERIKKETEIIQLKFDNIPNKTFIKMYMENLDMNENEIKEFNRELVDYVFEANRKSIMDSIKEYYKMEKEKEKKRGRPQGSVVKSKKSKIEQSPLESSDIFLNQEETQKTLDKEITIVKDVLDIEFLEE